MQNLHKSIKILALCTSLIGIGVPKQGNKILFVNDNGVKIYDNDYHKFLSIGINEKEIQFLTQTEYDEYSKINPIQTLKSENVLNEINTKAKLANKSDFSQNDDGERKVETYLTWYNVENMEKSSFFVKTNFSFLSSKKLKIKDLLGIGFGDNVTTDYVQVSGKGQRPRFSDK